MSCISPVVTLICGTDLICYNSWYRKAARTAREEHRFLPAKSRPWLQILERAALLLTLFGILVRALLGTGSSSAGRLYLAAILCGITPFAAMFLTYSAVKTGAGRAKRYIVTACVTAAVALASVGCCSPWSRTDFDSDEVPPELYDEEFRATVYHDALPLYLSDLGIEDENARWSCLSWGALALSLRGMAESSEMCLPVWMIPSIRRRRAAILRGSTTTSGMCILHRGLTAASPRTGL